MLLDIVVAMIVTPIVLILIGVVWLSLLGWVGWKLSGR
jgi:hypothetical protein